MRLEYPNEILTGPIHNFMRILSLFVQRQNQHQVHAAYYATYYHPYPIRTPLDNFLFHQLRILRYFE